MRRNCYSATARLRTKVPTVRYGTNVSPRNQSLVTAKMWRCATFSHTEMRNHANHAHTRTSNPDKLDIFAQYTKRGPLYNVTRSSIHVSQDPVCLNLLSCVRAVLHQKEQSLRTKRGAAAWKTYRQWER